MAAPRASWKGVLRIGAIECGVALYTAASTADRVSFRILNRRNRGPGATLTGTSKEALAGTAQ